MAGFIASNTIASVRKRLAVDRAILEAIGDRECAWRASVTESPDKQVWNVIVKGPNGFRWTAHFEGKGCAAPRVGSTIRAALEKADEELSTAPAIFAANHTSHLDSPAIFIALPPRWRRRLAPAVRQEQFRAYFQPQGFSRKDVMWAAIKYGLAGVSFNTYPLPQEMASVRRALRTTGDLVSRGYSPLVFPEGERTADGRMRTFQPGIGLMAVRLSFPVVPIFLDGLYEVYSIHDSWPKPGPVTVSIGRPLEFTGRVDYADAARQIENAVRNLEHQRT